MFVNNVLCNEYLTDLCFGKDFVSWIAFEWRLDLTVVTQYLPTSKINRNSFLAGGIP